MNTSNLLEQLLRASQQGGSGGVQGGGLGGLGGLLGGLLNSSGSGSNAAAGGGLGGLLGGLGGLLGGAPASGTSQTRSGGMNYAALASLGMAAFQAYQAWQRQQASAPQQAIQTVDQLDGQEAEAHSHAVLRALIAAAKADGRIDENEQQMISTEIGRHTDEPQLKQWLDDEVAKPLNAADFAEYAADPGLATEVYLASLMMVNDQAPKERSYLDDLAAQLQLAPELQLHLEQQVKKA